MSDEQQECQKAKVKMRRLSDEQQECQSTPLLDLAAARLVKSAFSTNIQSRFAAVSSR